MDGIEQKAWWEYLGEDLRELLNESQYLLKEAENIDVHDYSFIIFPAAKAYEGFLKKIFFDLKFITEEDFYGKHFRIGKSLNPSLPMEFRRDQVFDKIVAHVGGRDLPEFLWDTWRQCRNLTFHWFPNEKNVLTLTEAKDCFDMIIRAIDRAFEECKMK